MTDKALADILARTYAHRVTAFRPLTEGEERLCEAAPCALSRSEHTSAPTPPSLFAAWPEALYRLTLYTRPELAFRLGDRTRARGEYPLLAVSVREDGTVLVDGGRQAEHTYRVTVSAASDREREGNTALLSSLTPILLRGVPMGERTLHPLELKTEGETLTFTVELCVPLPQPEKPGMEPPGRMATLNLDI